MAKGWRAHVPWIIAAVLATGLVALVFVNLTPAHQRVERALPHHYATGDSQFVRVMGTLLGPTLERGNRATALTNGDEIFPAMLEAIRSARHTIDFETYIYWSGRVGEEFGAALSERARAGVRVHLLVDWLGAHKMDHRVLEEMRAAGVRIAQYRPLKWYTIDRLNNRTHRKLLVVDGRVGFTGGVGVADQWLGHAQDKEHWRDSHFRFEGPVVAQMQSAFLDNWIETEGEVLDGPAYFPPLEPVGDAVAQAFSSTPGEASASMRLMYLLAVASAARSIRIANAYFLPDSVLVDMLVAARRRGVSVEIIVPGPILDAQVVRRASRAMWGPLLAAGVRIYEYQPTMYHTKVMIVDDLWVSVGSTNFDDRSFRLNDETNVNVLDRAFGEEQARIFAADRSRSHEVTFDEWRRRPLKERLQERVAHFLSSQL